MTCNEDAVSVQQRALSDLVALAPPPSHDAVLSQCDLLRALCLGFCFH